MKPGKTIKRIKKDTQPLITSFFKTKDNNKYNLLIRYAQLNDTEIKSNQTNTNINKLNYDKHQPTIASNNIIKKKISKTASSIGKIKTTTSLFLKKLKD